jgi:ABC-type microcin C transport system permease subunit YejE
VEYWTSSCDAQGRDVVAHIIYGFRISMLFGLAVDGWASQRVEILLANPATISV